MNSLKNHISTFCKSDFEIGCRWREAVSVFLYWAVPGFLTVLAVNELSKIRTVQYYEDAISQGIGPILWNFIAVIGCVFFFFCIIFNKASWIAKFTQQILVNVYAIGSLTFGLLLAQYLLLIPEIKEHFEVWTLIILFPLTWFYLAVAFFLNLIMWYLSHLARPSSSFLVKLSNISFLYRVPLSVLGITVFLSLLWLEA